MVRTEARLPTVAVKAERLSVGWRRAGCHPIGDLARRAGTDRTAEAPRAEAALRA